MPLNTAKNLLTVKEVAEFLRINPITVYRMAQNNSIPALKINSSWRFRLDSIEKWLEEKEIFNGASKIHKGGRV
ncbi:MAG: helix-turn-helix domain-containing protein [Candidatus Margulisiibacteriota bacterium]